MIRLRSNLCLQFDTIVIVNNAELLCLIFVVLSVDINRFFVSLTYSKMLESYEILTRMSCVHTNFNLSPPTNSLSNHFNNHNFHLHALPKLSEFIG